MSQFYTRLSVVFLALASVSPFSTVCADDTFRCALAESTGTLEIALSPADTIFFRHRPGLPGTLWHRDLEFHWDSLYTHTLPSEIRQTLDRFGGVLADPAHAQNPFDANMSDIELVYNYFQAQDSSWYDRDPFHLLGYIIGHACDPNVCKGPGFDLTEDYAHLDVYIYKPGHDPENYSRWPVPSRMQSPYEDWDTGHPYRHNAIGQNSVSMLGPSPSATVDLDYTGWTKPDEGMNHSTVHEFQHAFRYKPSAAGYGSAGMLDEFFGSAAQIVSGMEYRPRPEVRAKASPYVRDQYTLAYWFAAYLAFNFQGSDTRPLLPDEANPLLGFGDDLLWKWSRSERTPRALRDRLADSSCWNCAEADYFHPGGPGLPSENREQLLLHNWRVASYVNSPSLAEGQFGYPAQYGFSPGFDHKAWQNQDGNCANDEDVVPRILVADPGWAVRETTLAGQVPRDCPGSSESMNLSHAAAKYFVIKSDPALTATTQDLVIRITPVGIVRTDSVPNPPCDLEDPRRQVWRDGRLLASVVAYSEQSDDLWKHPDWASIVFGPTWIDVDSVAGALEFVIPNFGQTPQKAVLVTLSRGDGPAQGNGWDPGTPFTFPLEFQLSCALRRTPYLPSSLSALVQTPAVPDDFPAWSPDGTELVFESQIGGEFRQVYRKDIAGGPVTPLLPQENQQRAPDWSPRGDWIAFSSDAGGAQEDIWIFHVQTQELRRLTDGILHWHSRPCFSPNGQRIAYAHQYVAGDGSGTWHGVRVVDLQGVGEGIATSYSRAPVSCVRWTRDGGELYFARGESLFVVSVTGGAVQCVGDTTFGVTSFDLPVGRGPMVSENVGAYPYRVDCWDDWQYQPYRRIALGDPGVPHPRPRFYRTGWEFARPRWSPDNTRVVYSSGYYAAESSRDLFIGQVSYNHPPVFLTPPSDTVLTPGQSLTLSLAATDPDGDEIFYEGAYLPGGASINGSTFTWPNVPLIAEQYVVLRARDSHGGVAQRVVRISVRPHPVTDLTVVETGRHTACVTWTEPGQNGGQPDAIDLRFATSGITEANFFTKTRAIPTPSPGGGGTQYWAEVDSLTDCQLQYFAVKSRKGTTYSPLSNVPTRTTACSGGEVICAGDGLMAGGGGPGGAGGGNSVLDAIPESQLYGLGPATTEDASYLVWLRVGANAEASLDQVTLGKVDHDVAVEAVAAGDSVLVGRVGPRATILDAAQHDVSSPLSPGGRGYVGSRGEVLRVRLADSSGTTGLLIESAGSGTGAADSSGILVQAPNGDAWATLATVFPRRRFDAQVVDVHGHTELRLVFVGSHAVRTLREFTITGRTAPTALSLDEATHSAVGDVREAVATSGGASARLAGGDTLVARFTAPKLEAGNQRTLFLRVKGSVSGTRPAGRISDVQPVAAQPGYVFSLGAARPNPGRGTVAIGYSLARRSPVSIRVYDVAGRLVRTLVEGTGEAGPHAAVWDGLTDSGSRVGAGVYFYRMTAGGWQSQRKVVFMAR